MIYYRVTEPGDDPATPRVTTFSEDDIRRDYYPLWHERMVRKYGEDTVEKNFGFKDCLDDWIIVHYAERII